MTETSHPLITPPVEKWLTALESGEWHQCAEAVAEKNYETNGRSYCCIGVAAAIINPGFPINAETDEAVQWMREAGIPLSDDGQISCVKMNDEDGKSFAEIAAIIRATPEYYFWGARS